ncbi:MAG TPA: M23 family metallopeptidase [Blastocatellia bacterium]|nr:M23 family metallopeptidase [Blastocatellia bacterium]
MKYLSEEARRQFIKRAATLSLACLLVIIGFVFLMNLESPRGAAQAQTIEPARESLAVSVSLAQASLSNSAAPEVRPLDMKLYDESSMSYSSDFAALSAEKLLIPVSGVSANQLRDSFNDARSEGRVHQAIDIMAPGGTPVMAVTDGTVMKLHRSAKGGITLYQSDPSGRYVYYYAHLMRYADGMAEGKSVKRGDVIGYVGDTGNPGPGNYHLHFAISKPDAPGKWSGGTPINPYPILASGR